MSSARTGLDRGERRSFRIVGRGRDLHDAQQQGRQQKRVIGGETGRDPLVHGPQHAEEAIGLEGRRLLEKGRDGGQQDGKGSDVPQQLQRPPRRARAEEAQGLLEDPRRSAPRQLSGRVLHGGPGLGIDAQVQLGREAETASQEVAQDHSAQANLGGADGSNGAGLEIAPAGDVVDHLAQAHVVEQAVDGEVPPPGILLGGAKDVVLADEQVGVDSSGILGQDLLHRILAEGGNLDDLLALEVDVRQPEAPADQAAVAEGGPHLLGVGRGGDVEVLGAPAEQEVAHAAAHQVGLVAVAPQVPQDLEGIDVERGGVDLGGRRGKGGIGQRGRIERGGQ